MASEDSARNTGDYESLRRMRPSGGLRYGSSIGPYGEIYDLIRSKSLTLAKCHRIIPGYREGKQPPRETSEPRMSRPN